MEASTMGRAGAAATMMCAVLALGACGGGGDSDSKDEKPAKPAAKKTPSPRASQSALVEAAKNYDVAYSRFKTRIREDAAGNDLTAAHSDASQFRTAVFDYDAAVRKIAFPPSRTADVNSLLGKSRTVIADLDAISQVESIGGYNRLVSRLGGDNMELIAGNNALHAKLR